MYPQLYPIQSPYGSPSVLPQVNAVKIDVNNPQAYGGANSQGQLNPVAPQQYAASPYNYPYAPAYNIPQVPQYNTVGAYPIPPVNAQVPAQMQVLNQQNNNINNVPSAPVNAQVAQNPNIAAAPVPVIASTAIPAQAATAVAPTPVQPAAPAVQVMPVPVPVATLPVTPAPVVPQPNPVVNAPVTQNVNVNPAIPAAVVDNKQNTTVAPVAPVKEETKLPGGIEANALISALSSNNPDEQTAAIQKIAEVAQTDPVAARALLNEQTFGQLVNVINADTSKLQGPTGKSDPKNLSPLEKAEINKQFAVYTLAILQKNFRDEINKEMKKNNLPDIAINDLPYIKEGIVNNLKDNPNPTIREACLSALNYVGRPEDKEVLRVLYDISAKHDSNPAVRTSAQDYLSKLPA